MICGEDEVNKGLWRADSTFKAFGTVEAVRLTDPTLPGSI